jgi:hypothetical protein
VADIALPTSLRRLHIVTWLAHTVNSKRGINDTLIPLRGIVDATPHLETVRVERLSPGVGRHMSEASFTRAEFLEHCRCRSLISDLPCRGDSCTITLTRPPISAWVRPTTTHPGA